MANVRPRALVTGAGRGLGREVARRLAADGWEVLGTVRSTEVPLPEGVSARQLDVADPASIDALVANLRGEGRPLDALVNNAGVALDGFDAEVARRTLDVNLHGPVRLTEGLRPLLGDGARVVMVSSGMGELDGLPAAARRRLERASTRPQVLEFAEDFVRAVAAGTWREEGYPTSAYRVSKAALNAWTRLVAGEWPDLRVNAACPGWVRTDMGGSSAPRSVERGAEGLVWAATLAADGPTGGFFRDGRALEW